MSWVQRADESWTSASEKDTEPVVLEIDWSRCRAHGHCSALLPEVVALDRWGYPVLEQGSTAQVPGELLETARRAVSWCPNLALRLHGR